MSSRSDPHGIAFNLAAQKCGVPVALVTHGMPVRPVAKLSYDLAVVHCQAARQTYLEAGCQMARVLVHGRRQHHAPMPADPLPGRLAVGIFLCKDVNEERLRAVVEQLLGDPRVSRILVRPHPTNLWAGLDAWIASRNDPRVRRSSSGPVFRDLEAPDIVLAGNSSVLIEAVTAGRPSGYVPGLDHGSPDLHGLVARGLIYPIDDELGFAPDAMLRFYQRPDWSTVLRLFANIDEDEASVAARVGPPCVNSPCRTGRLIARRVHTGRDEGLNTSLCMPLAYPGEQNSGSLFSEPCRLSRFLDKLAAEMHLFTCTS